jgi:hypothetical protein
LDNFSFFFYDKNTILRAILKIFILMKKKHVIFYIHNLDFDGLLIIREISKYKKIKFDFLIDKMKIYYLKIIFADKILEFRCS